ncbi:MAG: inositol monophosphatase, partial [Actinobacteria bacterium ATB1]|nr:inositol monophosphatase [Actinobacteria bacterium ATB1]
GFSYDPDVRSLQAALLTRVMGRVRDIRREGSAALDLAYVAAGRLDAFYEAPLAPWDMAAGRLLVVQAGGIVKPLRLPGIPGEGVIAGRAEVVETVESSIRGWHAPEASQPPRQ